MLPSSLLLVRQNFPDRRLADVPAEARRQLEDSSFAARLRPGARVAIGVGSRGIANIATIVHSVVQYWQRHGMAPFVFPAMGSHGAATPEGQADVLARFGMTEQSMGCPIISRSDVVSLGKTDDGIEVFMDAAAHGADAVMIVPRVKWHTTFDGRVESGLMKMMAIGLGKFAGAQKYHTHAQRLGLEHVIRTVGRRVLQSGKVLGGLAIVEDAHHNTAKLDAVPADCMEQRDEENLALAKSWMPGLPCDVDVLVVDEMGKNISGTGMDAKVVNRGPSSESQPLARIAVDPANLRSRSGSTEPRQRARDRHGGRHHGPAGPSHRLGTHTGQRTEFGHPVAHSRSPRTFRAIASACNGLPRPPGKPDPAAVAFRLDSKHAGARSSGD